MSLTFPRDAEAPVLVIGAAGIDIIGRLQGDLESGTSNPARIRTSFGGVARNIAQNLAHLGQPVCLLSAVGTDQMGEDLLNQINAAGVDTHAVLRVDDANTGAYLAVLDTHSKLRFALDDMRITQNITPAYLKAHAHLFQQASLLFLDANLPPNTLRTAFSLARKAQIPVFADPTSHTLAPKFAPYLAQIAMLIPNAAEAAIYCETPFVPKDPQQALSAAKALVARGVRLAIVTLAEFGVCYATAYTQCHIPAIRTEIVDPTGAGDALTATLIFALLNDIPLDDAMRLGVSAASLTLRHRGAVYPDLTLEKLYDHLIL
ncbi:MAG: PfkB family carbohydrate kinase [Anaerolineales bacterium]